MLCTIGAYLKHIEHKWKCVIFAVWRLHCYTSLFELIKQTQDSYPVELICTNDKLYNIISANSQTSPDSTKTIQRAW